MAVGRERGGGRGGGRYEGRQKVRAHFKTFIQAGFRESTTDPQNVKMIRALMYRAELASTMGSFKWSSLQVRPNVEADERSSYNWPAAYNCLFVCLFLKPSLPPPPFSSKALMSFRNNWDIDSPNENVPKNEYNCFWLQQRIAHSYWVAWSFWW